MEQSQQGGWTQGPGSQPGQEVTGGVGRVQSGLPQGAELRVETGEGRCLES